jgi:hypothetical protein
MAPKAVAMLALVAAVAAGCGGAGQAPHFRAARGWHVLVEPGQTASAANVRFVRSDRHQSFPTRTIASLPPRGVLIWLEWVRPRKTAVDTKLYPPRPLPLRVVPTTYIGAPEGTRCPSHEADCILDHLVQRESGWDSDLWIFVGSSRRSAAQIAAANSELAKLQFG